MGYLLHVGDDDVDRLREKRQPLSSFSVSRRILPGIAAVSRTSRAQCHRCTLSFARISLFVHVPGGCLSHRVFRGERTVSVGCHPRLWLHTFVFSEVAIYPPVATGEQDGEIINPPLVNRACRCGDDDGVHDGH